MELYFGIEGHHSQRQNDGTSGHEAMGLAAFLTAVGIVNNVRFYGSNS